MQLKNKIHRPLFHNLYGGSSLLLKYELIAFDHVSIIFDHSPNFFPTTVINGGGGPADASDPDVRGRRRFRQLTLNSGGRGSGDIWKQIQTGPELFP